MERLFTLDAQLIFDAVVLGLSMFVLFSLLSYLLFNPVRTLLENRRQRIADDREAAKQEKQEAIAYKDEYENCLLYTSGSGGIFAALWELLEASGLGMEIEMSRIAVQQETVEVCEYYLSLIHI